MKTIKVYSDKDCVIRYGVWPEEPEDMVADPWKEQSYNQALQKAKDESVPFEDQQLALEVTNLRINKTYLPGWTTLPDCFYDIEFNGEIEIINSRFSKNGYCQSKLNIMKTGHGLCL